MVTEQEIQQIASQRVPRRSFGSRIGAKEQQNIIENKQKAQEVLAQINQPQQQTQQAQTRDQLKQSALNYLLAKGKANEAFRNLTPKEQEEVQNQANDLERTRSRIQAIRAVSQIEQQGDISLTPQIREQLINQAIETGQIKFTLNQGRQELYSPVKNQQVSSLTEKQVREVPLFKNTPFVYDIKNKINSNQYSSLKNAFKSQTAPFTEGVKETGKFISKVYRTDPSIQVFKSGVKETDNYIFQIKDIYFKPTPSFGSEKLNQEIINIYRTDPSINLVKSGVYEVFKGESFKHARDYLSGRTFAEANIKPSSAKIDLINKTYTYTGGFSKVDASKDFYEGKIYEGTKDYDTQFLNYNLGIAYQKEVNKNLLGMNLQSAVLGSFVYPSIPKIIKVPVRPLSETSYGFQIQETVVSQGIPRVEASYQILSERVPPLIILDSTEAGGLLGSSDKFKIQLERYSLIKTVLPASDKQALTLSTKSGKQFEFDILTGKARQINMQTQLAELNPTQKYLFSKLAGREGKFTAQGTYFKNFRDIDKNILTEIKNSYKTSPQGDNLYKVLGKKDVYSTSEITSTALSKNVRQGDTLSKIYEDALGLEATGKSKIKKETVTRLKGLFETDKYEVYQADTLFKDITKPFARARGKTPRLKEFIIQIKEPRIEDEISYVNIINPNKNIKKTPLSVTFGKQELVQVPKSLPKTPRTPKAKTITTKASPIGSGASSILFRVSSGTSSSYSDTSDISRGSFTAGFDKGFEKIFPSSQGKTITGTQPLSFERNIPLEVSKGIPREISVNINKQVPREISRNVPREISRSVPREISKEVQRQIPREILRQISRQVPRNPPRNPPKIPSPPRLPRPPRTSKEPFIFSKGLKKGFGGLTEGYKTYYFTKGNKVYLPSISTKEEAIFKGQKATLNSLSARFGIEETKGLIKDNNVNAPDRYSKYFRNYKISKGKRINTPNVFIQKLGKRLSTKTERGLIQKARRGR